VDSRPLLADFGAWGPGERVEDDSAPEEAAAMPWSFDDGLLATPVEAAAAGAEAEPFGGPDSDAFVDALPEPSAEPDPASLAGPDPVTFAAAVEAFIAGSGDAAREVEELAAELRERLALDPLADAVERLVREAGNPPKRELIAMAGAVINPAVASRIVQRIGHVRDEARKGEYTLLCDRLGPIMAKAFRGALTGATAREARRRYYDILLAMGETSRPIIEEMVEDENTLLARSGVALMGEIGGARALELVTSGLAHPDARVRREAVMSLGKVGNEDSGALAVALMEDSDPEVRVAAASAAGALKVARALRPMLALLDAAGDSEGALPLIDALGRLGDPGAVPTLEKHAVKGLFSKPRVDFRIAAYRALHQIGTPHARDLVQQALSDKEPRVRAAVRGIVGAPAP
jgi:hypothetical protein